MHGGELVEDGLPVTGEAQVDLAVVAGIGHAHDVPLGGQPVHQPTGGVRLDQQRRRHLADRRPTGRRGAADGQQQLVLGVRQAVRGGGVVSLPQLLAGRARDQQEARERERVLQVRLVSRADRVAPADPAAEPAENPVRESTS